MKYRKLGRTSLECSEIGLGTWALGSRVYGAVEQSASDELIREAIHKGINFFDTAPLYGIDGVDGMAETVLGRSLGPSRDDVIISTKFGRTATDPDPARFNAAEARVSCEASLRRLGRDWIDLFFFHSPFSGEEIDDDVWTELGRLRQEGKIRYIGHSVSMFRQTGEVSAQWMRERRIDAIQVVLSLFNRETRSLIKVAVEERCGVVARECLSNGFLSGKIREDTVFPEGSLNARHSRGEIAERVGYADVLREKLVRDDVGSLPEAAYRWVLDQPGVSLALSGACNREELIAPVHGSQTDPFSDELRETLEQLHRRDFEAA